MILECRKLDQISLFPEGGHTPRYPFLRFRDGIVDRIPNGPQVGLGHFLLELNILLNAFWLDAIVILFSIFEFPAAFRTLPHHNHPK